MVCGGLEGAAVGRGGPVRKVLARGIRLGFDNGLLAVVSSGSLGWEKRTITSVDP